MPRPATIPDGTTVYAIGDVHGERALLDVLLAGIEADLRDAASGTEGVVIFLGDYIDRGPDSRGVLDRLASGDLPGSRQYFLMGNHEEAVLQFLEDPAGAARWLQYGGVQTLANYGIVASVSATEPGRCEALSTALRAALPTRHLAFLRGLDPSVVLGDYAFVHAGVRPGRPFEQQRTEDLLWIREPFLSSRREHGKVIVHGHTVVDGVERYDNRIAVDTGAYATGRLSAVALRRDEVRVLEASMNGVQYSTLVPDRVR